MSKTEATRENIAAALGVTLDPESATETPEAPEAPDEADAEEVIEAPVEETPEDTDDDSADEDASPEPQKPDKPAPADKPADKPAEEDRRVFTDAEVSAIVTDRLARDRKSELVRKMEALAGKPLEDFLPEFEARLTNDLQDSEGLTEEEAKQRVSQSVELAELRREQAELKAQQEQLARQATYNAQQQRYDGHRHAALVRDLKPKIDELSKHGAIGDFDSALYYTAGRQLIEGDLYQRMEDKIRREVLASVGRRQAAGTEGSTAAAHETPGPQLSAQEKQFAALSGVTHKAYASSVAEIKKRGG